MCEVRNKQFHYVSGVQIKENQSHGWEYTSTCSLSHIHHGINVTMVTMLTMVLYIYLFMVYLMMLRLRVFKNRVLRRIFGPKRDEVTGGWRKLHNKELHGLYSSPSIIRVIKARMMRWVGHVVHMGEVRGAYNILVRRPEGRRPLGRPRRRWEDNIEMDLREIGFGDVDWINFAQDRDRWWAVVNTVTNLRVP
jgi:hypothetical protein